MVHINNQNFSAVILDMDGVITQTATLHAKAWKQMFDEFLEKRNGENFEPLDIDKDYRKYIDGIPRFDGVRNFLKSRDIELPEGQPDDEPGKETVYGLGMRKNDIFLELLEKEGAHVFPDTLEMLTRWKKEGVKLAVISASRNCRYVLETAGLLHFFEVLVDGVVSKEMQLKGKPEPDIFLTACEKLGVEKQQAVVIEDAISGVEAGKKGGFGLVVGVARNGGEEVLKEAGADMVVTELTMLQ